MSIVCKIGLESFLSFPILYHHKVSEKDRKYRILHYAKEEDCVFASSLLLLQKVYVPNSRYGKMTK